MLTKEMIENSPQIMPEEMEIAVLYVTPLNGNVSDLIIHSACIIHYIKFL